MQQRASKEQAAVRDNRAAVSLLRVTGGSLHETLRLQADRAAEEEQEAARYFGSMDETLRTRLAASEAESTRANEIVAKMSAQLPSLKTRAEKAGSSPPVVPDTLLAEARQAIGFPGVSAGWPALKENLTLLSAKLAKPVHIKDKPALETEVGETTGQSALGSLPPPDAWEAERKALLEKWLKSKTP